MLWAASACVLASCGTSEHPAGMVDFDSGAAVVNPTHMSSPCVDDAGAAPSPNAEGLCGQYFLNAMGDAPNLYFVIDRSGSMGVMVEGRQKYDAVAGAAVDLVRSLGSKVKVGAAVFPGRHVDAAHVCQVGEEVFATTLGDAVRGGSCDPDGPVTRAFSSSISLPNNAPPSGATPTAATLNAILPGLAALPGRTAIVLATDGGPNCNATANCNESNCIPNIEHDPPGCTSGVNCCSEAIAGPDASRNCLDSLATKNAVMALHEQGIKTFVVGVPGSSPYAALLDDLAVAGGTARLGTTAYYDVEHISELDGVLDSIGATVILSCHLHLDEPPPDHNLVNVYLDSQVLTYGAADGWRWTGDFDGGREASVGNESAIDAGAAPSYVDLDLTGTACTNLEVGKVRRLEVTFGCKTEIVR